MILLGAGGSGDEKGRLQYRGEVIVLCEIGQITFEVGDEVFTIEAGDSLHFKTSVPHCWKNTGEAESSALFFGTLPKGLQKGISERLAQLEVLASEDDSAAAEPSVESQTET